MAQQKNFAHSVLRNSLPLDIRLPVFPELVTPEFERKLRHYSFNVEVLGKSFGRGKVQSYAKTLRTA